MKQFIYLSVIFLFSVTLSAQNYNSKLADSLGADNYGMKQYVLAILKTGSNKTKDKKVLDELFSGHMANIERLANEGKLIVAGPITKNEKTYRGIFILNVKTIDEAKALTQTDPSIKAKLFDVEYYLWYGSAALPMYLNAHQQIQKEKP